MTQTVQLALADGVYAAALREALTRCGPWRVVSVDVPNSSEKSVVVLDEETFHGLLGLSHPERVVLITRKDPQHLSQAWDAGIVSVVSQDDPPSTVLLAIMAAALRVPEAAFSGISPTAPTSPAPISPEPQSCTPRRWKT